jgi:hypothetical protein
VSGRAVLLAAVAFSWSSALVAQPIRGVWTADRSKWKVASGGTAVFVQLSLRRTGPHGNWDSSHPVLLSELPGLTEAQLDTTADVRFSWKRDAGTFVLDGSFRDGDGAGHYVFAANPDYQADLKRRGYGGIDDEKSLALAVHDVSRAFIDELAKLGYDKVGIDDLVALRIHGATAEYVRGLASIGYKGLPVDKLVAFRIHGASLDWLREMQSLGYTGLPADDAVAFRIHGVTPDFVRSLKALGYDGLKPDQLVALRIHGVTPDYIRRVQGRAGTVSVDHLVSMRIHGEEPQ